MKNFRLALLLTLILTTTATAQNHVLSLDGQGDYVKIPSDIGAGLHEATIECWVKWKGFQHYSQPFNFGEAWKMMGLNNPGSGPNLQFFIYPRK